MKTQEIKINGIKVISLAEFAELTNNAIGTIKRLIHKGNRIRKIKAIKLGNKLFIPVTEIIEFPFATPGKSGKVYKYKLNKQKSEFVPYIVEIENR